MCRNRDKKRCTLGSKALLKWPHSTVIDISITKGHAGFKVTEGGGGGGYDTFTKKVRN